MNSRNLTLKRRLAKETFYEPLLTFFENEGDVELAELPDPQVNLPDGIHILTLKKVSNMNSDEGLILLRLENIYSNGKMQISDHYLTESDEGFKVVQNTFYIIWRRPPD